MNDTTMPPLMQRLQALFGKVAPIETGQEGVRAPSSSLAKILGQLPQGGITPTGGLIPIALSGQTPTPIPSQIGYGQ